jgi:amino acid transporter
MTSQAPQAEAGLVRAIGVRALTAAIVNTTIGAGIFVLPAQAAGDLGTGAPIAYLVCAVLMLLVVGSFAMAGSRVDISGGIFAYASTAFGPFIGFLVGVIQVLACVLAVAGVSTALVAQLAVTWPAVGHGVGRWLVLAALFGGLAAVNIRGVKKGARTVEVFTLAKLLPLAIFVAAGAFVVMARGVPVPSLPALDAVGRSALVLIFAFLGAEVALISSGEVRSPARTVPASLFLALGLTTTVYLAIQLVAQGVLGPELKTFADAPLARAASQFLGAAGAPLMLAGAVISMFGYVSGDMLGTPRSLFAFGRDGLLPRAFARVHARYHTPYVAIAVHAAAVFLLAANGTFGKLVLLSNVASLSLYLMGCLAAIELWRRDVQLAERPFNFPGAVVVPIGGAAVVIWLLSHATKEEFAAEAVVVGLASLVYGLRALSRRRTGALPAQ